MTNLHCGALLFDIDGTLAHTDPVHIRAFNAMLIGNGRKALTNDEYAQIVLGRANTAIFSDLFPDLDVAKHRLMADAKEAAFRDMAHHEIVPMPGLFALMDAADAQGIPMAAVTNAPRANAEMILGALGITARFRTWVIGDELARGKPDPLPYLTACERLGVKPETCLAFEDSRSGVQSASGAGTFIIGVMSSLPEAELVAVGARFAIRDFSDPRLAGLMSGLQADS
jgi:HAD superfamily hydrolase (TIGR01509 family)